MASYFDKIQEQRAKEAQKKEVSIKKTASMSDAMLNVAASTIGLRDIEAFKAYLNFESQIIVDILSAAFVPKNHNQKMTYGESMAFNEGFAAGVQFIRDKRTALWHQYAKDMDGNINHLTNKKEKA